MKLFHVALSCAMLAAAPAFAADVSGATGGIFVDPLPADAVTTGLGTSDLTFGTAFLDSPPNRLTFTGSSFDSAFETPFKVGSLAFYNGAVVSGTGLDTIDLSLSLNFLSPILPAVISSFTFKLVSTDNLGDPDADADYLFFPSSFSSTSFAIGGTTYTVKLTGFGNIVGDGFLTSSASQLHVRENADATADLFAIVTTQTAAVPEPASWAMFIGGFGLIGGTMRRRQRVTMRFA